MQIVIAVSLHVADRDRRVVRVAHHLVLDLLVPLDALLDQHLPDRRQGERIFHQNSELPLIFREPAAGSPQRKSRSQNDGIADLTRGTEALLHGTGSLRGQDRLAQGLAQLFEQLAIFGQLDGPALRSEKLCMALSEDPLFLQLDGEIEPCLPADPREDRVGALFAHYFGDVFEGEGLHIDLVGDGCVGHDRRRVGVAQDDLVALLLQREAGLRAGVVELGGLADHDGAGADDEDLVDIGAFGHRCLLFLERVPLSCSRKFGTGKRHPFKTFTSVSTL